MQKIGTTTSGSIIVEMSIEEYEIISKIAVRESAQPQQASDNSSHTSFDEKVAFVRPRLLKLAPKKSDALVRSVKTMFNFTGGISDEEANRIIVKLKKDRVIRITPANKVEYDLT